MPSTAYSGLLNIVAQYIEPVKAADIVIRQVTAKKFTPDSLTQADLAAVQIHVATAAGLYVASADMRTKMKEAIRVLCAA